MTALDPQAFQMIRDRFDQLDDRMDRQDAALADIQAHVSETNGRVGKLELWRARLEGAHAAWRWVPALIGTAAAAGVGTLVALIH